MTPGLVVHTAARRVAAAQVEAFEQATGVGHVPGSLAADTLAGPSMLPGQLVVGIAEGLAVQAGLTGHGIALLELASRFERPAYVGDSLSVRIEFVDARPSSSGPARGVVRSRHDVCTQRGERVVSYDAVRLIRGLDLAAGGRPS